MKKKRNILEREYMQTDKRMLLTKKFRYYRRVTFTRKAQGMYTHFDHILAVTYT